MNKLKKSLALIATLAIASTAFVACGGDSSTGTTESKAEESKAEESKAEESKEEESKAEEESKTEDAGAENKVAETGDKLSILCWTPDDVTKMIENFESANPEYKGKCEYVNVGSKGQEAREGYANYFAGDGDVDLFVLEADWILDYINKDEYTKSN